MHYSDPLYRPPVEANSILLQVTSGCSHNRCKFCNMFEGVSFRVSPLTEIEEDLNEIRQYNNSSGKRVYLVGGDPFVLSFEKLKLILLKIKEYLPKCERISMAGRISNTKNKTIEQLKELRSSGLSFIYFGMESGDDETLLHINKKQTAQEIVEQCKKIEEAGIEYHLIYLNGLAGAKRGNDHALESAKVINQLKPTEISFTSLTLFPRTELYKAAQRGKFIESSELERIIELKTLIEQLDTDTFIYSHYTTAVSLEGKFPENKQKMLDKLQHIIDNFDEDIYRKRREKIRTV